MIKKVLRTALIAYVAVMFAWFSVPIAVGVFNLGNATGIGVFGIALLALILPDKAMLIISRVREKLIGRFAVIATAVLAVAIAITTVVLTVFMTVAAYKAPADDSVLIVLGCRVYDERPSVMLQSRIDAAYDYLAANDGAVCILSGGQGDDENISEAECIRRELVNRDISPERIFIEDKSTSTRENIEFSNKVIEDNGLKGRPVAIATNEFHQFRAQLIAHQCGIEATAVSAASELYLLPSYYVRELYAVLVELIT